MPYRAAKGMNDILPGDVGRWHLLEGTFRRLATTYGFEEIRTPLLEPTELFVRSVGETTDIVQKEMFTFQHHSDSLTLRPEGTASAARAYVQHSVHAREAVTRWYYAGPMFRAERPQRGRYRQFYQAGCEIFGDPGPACDAELIALLHDLFRELGISDLEIALNSIGGPAARARHRDALHRYLLPKADQLSEASQRRLHDNPLRILDSKSPVDQELVQGAPSIADSLDADDRAHFDELCRQLDRIEIPYTLETGLVRGLDYYTRTLFEIRSSAGSLGAQNALAGGGRYDAMIQDLGGPNVPAIGFAIGLDRVLLAMPETEQPSPPFCFIAPIGARATREALSLARAVRARGHRVDVDGRGNSTKSMLRRANSSGARLCVVLGDSELDAGSVQIKDLRERSQTDVPLGNVAAALADQLDTLSARSREELD